MMKRCGIIFAILFILSGCSSFGQKMKSFLGGKPPQAEGEKKKESYRTYSENQNVIGGPRRQYKRMTRDRFEEEALLQSNAGSLWVMEGQGAYLFSQNIVRMIGDPIGVLIEGEPREQLQAKVEVISKLIAKLEARAAARLRAPAAAPPANAQPTDPKNPQANQQAAQNQPPPVPPPPAEITPAEFTVKNVPARIVERMVDGNYRVKGSQPFMIGSREYKVIVTGVVRSEDFNEEGISASRLLDPKFDIVSVRRKDGDS